MLVLDTMSTIENGKLEIPFYHKGHLSLKSNTEVTVCLIPQSHEASLGFIPEMIVSPIKFASWPLIWRINAIFKEQQGIVHKLLTVVRDAELNVLTEESSSVENRDRHQIELIVDASEPFGGRFEPEDLVTATRALERRIASLCIDELAFVEGKPRIKVRPMKGLFTAYQRYHEALNDKSVAKPKVERTMVYKGSLAIPDSCLEMLRRYQPLRGLMSSDTKERILRVLFPPPDVQFTFVRISHHDSKGALAQITGELAQVFDIVTSLTRIQRQGNQNDFELMLYSKQYAQPDQEETRRQIIDNILSDAKFEKLGLEIAYPEKVWQRSGSGRAPRGGNQVAFEKNVITPKVSPETLQKSTAVIIREKIDEYVRLKESHHPFSRRRELDVRHAFLHRLLLEEDIEASSTREIFISYQFSREDLFTQVRARMDHAGCKPITGRDPDEESVFRTVIVKRIKLSQGFIGVWTGENSLISPWLVWELGVAQALNKPYRLLIHRSVDPKVWQPINPEKNHTLFTETEFAASFDKAVLHLLDDIKEIERRGLWDYTSR